MLRPPKRLLLCALALAGGAGCATLQAYSGAPRADSEVALLVPATSSAAHLLIERVNGRRVGLFQDRVEVLPGEHVVLASVVVEHAMRSVVGTHRLRFVAEPGHHYELRGDWHMYGPRIWIQDLASGARVAEAVTRPPRLPPVGAR